MALVVSSTTRAAYSKWGSVPLASLELSRGELGQCIAGRVAGAVDRVVL